MEQLPQIQVPNKEIDPNIVKQIIAGIGAGRNYGLQELAGNQRATTLQGLMGVDNPTTETQSPLIMENQQKALTGNAYKKPINWGGLAGTLGSYLTAAGQGMAGQPTTSAGLVGAAGGITKNMQNIRNYDSMSPYYKQMGYDVSLLDPRRGGAGLDTTPSKFIQMKSLADYRNNSLILRQTLGMLGDNTKRANVIKGLLNSGNITPQEAQEQLQTYGINADVTDVSNQTKNTNINEYMAPAKKAYYEQMPAIAGGRLGLQQQEFAIDAPYKQAQTAKALMELETGGIPLAEYRKMTSGVNAVESQLNRFSDSFKGLPRKPESYTAGQIRNLTGMQTQAEANFNSQRTLLFNKIARELGGEKGVLSDQDIARVEKSLPNLTDSYEQKQAKMQAVYDLLNDTKNKYGMNNQPVQPFTPNVNLTPIPNSSFNRTTKPTNQPRGQQRKAPTGGHTQVGKYKVTRIK